MLLLHSTAYDVSIALFIVAALVHVAIIVFYIQEFRGLPGNHIQIALNQYKNGGVKGKLFAVSLFLIIACFVFWVAPRFLK